MSNDGWVKDFTICMELVAASIQANAAATNNLAEAIHRHADLQMGEEEEEEDPIDRATDMSGRPVRNR